MFLLVSLLVSETQLSYHSSSHNNINFLNFTIIILFDELQIIISQLGTFIRFLLPPSAQYMHTSFFSYGQTCEVTAHTMLGADLNQFFLTGFVLLYRFTF